MKQQLLSETYRRLFKGRTSSNDNTLLKEANSPLDPNATYTVQIGITGGEFDPYGVKKISGNPLIVAKAIKKKAYDNFEDTDEPADEIVIGYKLDQDTYMVFTTEEDVVVIGRPKSETYGEFWSLLETDPDAASDMFDSMQDEVEEEI
jgi:hypothetical protein